MRRLHAKACIILIYANLFPYYYAINICCIIKYQKRRAINMSIQKKRIIPKVFLITLLCLEIISWIYVNLRLNCPYDQDSAKVIYHAVKMWESKSFVLPNWSYITTGEWDCTAFLAMPIYGITNNIFLAFALANIINIFLFVYIIIILFKSAKVQLSYAIIALIILLLPYSVGMLEYSNMLFFSAGQYIYKVLVPLCIIVLLDYEPNRHIFYNACFLITALLLLLTTTSSGLYPIVSAVFPILLIRLLYYIAQRKMPSKREVIALLMIIGVSILGIFIHYYENINSSADSQVFVSSTNLIINIQKYFIDSINIFGIFNNESISVISIKCITRVLKLMLAFFVFFLGLISIKDLSKVFKSAFTRESFKTDFSCKSIIKAELLSLTLINSLLVILTVPAKRYLLIGTVALIIASVVVFSDISIQQWCNYLIGISLIALVILSFRDFDKEYTIKYSPKTSLKIIEVAQNCNADNVIFFSSAWAEITRSFDTNLSCITYIDSETGFFDYDVYYGHKELDTLNQNNIVCLEKDINTLPIDQFGGYYYYTSVDNFDIYANIDIP